MEVRLNTRQFEYLKENLGAERPDLFKHISNSGDSLFKIDGEIAVEIRDWVGEKIQTVGYDTDYKLNEDGLILEQLEDLLFE